MILYYMVKSKINSEKVNYNESKEYDEEDIGITSTIYSYFLYDIPIEVALGREKYTYAQYDIIYYPIYLILNDEAKCKIGIFEINSNQLINIMDEDGDVDLNKGIVLFYHFMNKDFLLNIIEKHTPMKKDTIQNEIRDNTMIADSDVTEEIEEDEDDVTKLKIPKQNISQEKMKIDKLLKDGLFEIDENKKLPVNLQEESKEDAQRIKTEYQEKPSNVWIEKFMKNNYYDIIQNEGGGDCLFAVIRDAYDQIGYKITVEKLRAILAEEATDDLYQQYRLLYVNFLGELQSKEKEMKELKKLSVDLKKRNDNTKDKEHSKQIIEEAKNVLNKFNSVKAEKEVVKELMEEFKYMEKIDNLEKFKKFIQTSSFWADTWAISTLEKKLNIKIIILSKESYHSDDLDSVMKCGQLNDSDLEMEGKFNPKYYIITSYSGNHYELVSYKSKRILKYSEIPYDIKALIINKCMEKNAGPYYLIQDFRNFKMKLGLSADEGFPNNDLEDENMEYDLYDPEIIFEFHSKSDCNPKAGKGSGERIKDEQLIEFTSLNKGKSKDNVCNNWRRKLDDSWITKFNIDNLMWSSVEHYYLGSQFKKSFPDFYKEFSLDSNSEISKDIALARAAGGKTGKLKDKILRPKNIKIDADFYEIGINNRSEEERRKALYAKFTQNLDLKKILLDTKNAKLVHFVRSSPPVTDILLMKLRKELEKGNH